MKKIIYKYRLVGPYHNCYFNLPMRKGAQILSIQNQKGEICIWTLEDYDDLPAYYIESRKFVVFHTGKKFEIKENYCYLGTVQIYDLVFHIFEIVSDEKI